MSTEAGPRYLVDEASGTSAHVYEECLDPADFPVFLEISAVSEVSIDVTPHGTDVRGAIPRALAAKLGLVPTTVKQG